jgi:hypothetical protein
MFCFVPFFFCLFFLIFVTASIKHASYELFQDRIFCQNWSTPHENFQSFSEFSVQLLLGLKPFSSKEIWQKENFCIFFLYWVSGNSESGCKVSKVWPKIVSSQAELINHFKSNNHLVRKILYLGLKILII